MKRRVRIRIVVGVLLVFAFYVALYVHYRTSGQITHFVSSQRTHDVRATEDPWAELAKNMVSSNAVLHAIVVAQTPSVKVLNTVFWPLRRVEVAIRNDESGQQGGGEKRR